MHLFNCFLVFVSKNFNLYYNYSRFLDFLQDIFMTKKILVLFFCLTALGASCTQQKKVVPSPYDHAITVGENKINVQVVENLSDKQMGLSFRKSLAEDSGMLFDFTNDPVKKPGFWMKDMNFALDLVWIKDGKIIAIDSNVKNPLPNTLDVNLKLYSPPSEIDYVLEVNGGWCERHNVKTGTEVKI